MDVAQLMMSPGMPGAGAIASSESPLGDSVSSPLFGEMFARAASAHDCSGSRQGQPPAAAFTALPGKGVELLASGISSTVENVPEQGATLPQGSAAIKAGAGEGTIRPETAEIASAADPRLLSLLKGRKAGHDNAVAGAEEHLGEQLSSDAEPCSAGDVADAESVEHVSGVSTVATDTAKASPVEGDGDASLNALAGGLGVVALANSLKHAVVSRGLNAGMVENGNLAGLPESASVVARNVSHGLTTAMGARAEQPVLPESASAVARDAVIAAGQFHEEMQVGGTAWTEARPGITKGMSVQLANADFASDKQQAVFLLRTEAGPAATAGTAEGFSSVLNLAELEGVEQGDGTTAGKSEPLVSRDVSAATDNVPGGRKVSGNGHFAAGSREKDLLAGLAPETLKSEAKGGTVQRELPSGVSVVNPTQTVLSGGDAAFNDPLVHGEEVAAMGRISQLDGEGELRKEDGQENAPVEGHEKVVLRKEAFSSQGNSDMNRGFGAAGGNRQGAEIAVTPGSFDTVIKDSMAPLSEGSQVTDASEFSESILSQVRERIVSHEPTGSAERITLKLNPRELGELQITVRMENQKMSVDVTAQNHAVKEILLQNLDQLKDGLVRQNIAMDRFDVSTGSGQQHTFNQSFSEGRHAGKQGFEDMRYGFSGYYSEEAPVARVAYGEVSQSSLVDMRF